MSMIPVRLRVGYYVRTRRAGTPEQTHLQSTIIPAPLESVAAEHAPIVMRANRDDAPSSVDYRSYEGRLYRPMFDAEFMTRLTPDALDAYADLQALSLHSIPLRDYPAFHWEDPFGNSRRNAVGFAALSPPKGRRASGDDRDEKVSAALALSSQFIVVDGVVFLPAPPPAWGLGIDVHSDISLGRYGVSIPDMDAFDRHVWLIPPTSLPVPTLKAALASYRHPFMDLVRPLSVPGAGTIGFMGPNPDFSPIDAANARRLAARLESALANYPARVFGDGDDRVATLKKVWELTNLLKESASVDGPESAVKLSQAFDIVRPWAELHPFDHERRARTMGPIERIVAICRAPMAIEDALAKDHNADLISALAP